MFFSFTAHLQEERTPKVAKSARQCRLNAINDNLLADVIRISLEVMRNIEKLRSKQRMKIQCWKRRGGQQREGGGGQHHFPLYIQEIKINLNAFPEENLHCSRNFLFHSLYNHKTFFIAFYFLINLYSSFRSLKSHIRISEIRNDTI